LEEAIILGNYLNFETMTARSTARETRTEERGEERVETKTHGDGERTDAHSEENSK
jgi:hypothetical protein